MWINCEEYQEPLINLSQVRKIDRGKSCNGDFYIEFEYHYKYTGEAWHFNKESRRDEIYYKIINMLEVKTL